MTLTMLAIALAVMLFIAFWWGNRLPKTHVATSRLRIAAPIAEVWSTLVDFKGYPSWRPGVRRVELNADNTGLPGWTEFCIRNIGVRFQVLELEAPHRLVTRMQDENLPLAGRWTYVLEADGDQTLVTITEHDHIHHPAFRFLARYVLSHHAAMDVFLAALAKKFGKIAIPEHLSISIEDGLA